MKYVKRFTDFCGGFEAFCAIMFFVGQFMMYDPETEMGMLEKLQFFISEKNAKNFGAYLILIVLFILSVIIGVIFEKYPFICLSVSLLPMLQTIFMFSSKGLYEQPMLYIVLSLVHMAGNLFYALSLDKADGKRRAYWSVNLLGAVLSALCIYVFKRSKDIAAMALDDAKKIEELSDFDTEIFSGIEGGSAKLFLIIGILLLVTVVVSVVLRDLYYIDAALCIVPFLYSLWLFFTEKLTVFGGVAFTAVAVYFVFRILILFSEPMIESGKIEKKA